MMLRKKIKCVLIIALLCSMVRSFAFSGVEKADYQEAIDTIAALSLVNGYDDGTFKPDNNITRAEVAVILLRILNQEGIVSGSPSAFTDVPDNYFAKNAIHYLSNHNLINGISATKFAPEDNMTVIQFAKCLVDLLGYQVMAEANGGYKGGYLKVASELNLLKNVKYNNMDSPITRGMVAQIIFNAAHVKIYSQQTFSIDTVSYKKKGSFLEEYHNIYLCEGVIVQTHFTGLNAPSTLPRQKFEIKLKNGDSLLLDAGKIDVTGFIGSTISAYVKKTQADEYGTLIYFKNKTNHISLKAEQIVAYDWGQLTYYKNVESKEKESKVKILPGADVIYNDVYDDTFDLNNLTIKKGEVKLIDSDEDGVYDVILVYEYQTILFDKYAESDHLIIDKYIKANNLYFNSDDLTNYCLSYKFGSELDVSVMTEWDILTVFSSRNIHGPTVTKVYSNTESVTGAINSIDENQVLINDQGYKISDDYQNYISSFGRLEVGQINNFLLNHYNEIVGIKKVSTETSGIQFAYLIDLEANPIEESIAAKILTQDGILDNYDFASKFKLNDISNSKMEHLQKALRISKYSVDNSQEDLSQAIQIKLNSAAQIISVNTSKTLSGDSNPRFEAKFIESSLKFAGDAKAFDGKFLVGNNSIIFHVPEDRKKYDKYKIRKYTEITDGTFKVSAFNIDKLGVAELVVLKGDVATIIDADRPWHVITDITLVVVDDAPTLKYYFTNSNGQKLAYVSDEYTTFYNFIYSMNNKITGDDLNIGDVVRIFVNSETNVLMSLERLFNIKNLKNQSGEISQQGTNVATYDFMLRILIGRPVISGSTSAKVRIHNPYTGIDEYGNKDLYWSFYKTKFIVCNETTPGKFNVKVGSYNDIKDLETYGTEKASYLVVKSRYAAMQELYIFNFQEDPCKGE